MRSVSAPPQETLLTLERLGSNISQILGNSYACPKLLCSFSQQIIPPDANYLASCFTDGKQIYNEIFTFPETQGKLSNFTSIPKSAPYARAASLSSTDSYWCHWPLKSGGSGTPQDIHQQKLTSVVTLKINISISYSEMLQDKKNP